MAFTCVSKYVKFIYVAPFTDNRHKMLHSQNKSKVQYNTVKIT